MRITVRPCLSGEGADDSELLLSDPLTCARALWVPEGVPEGVPGEGVPRPGA